MTLGAGFRSEAVPSLAPLARQQVMETLAVGHTRNRPVVAIWSHPPKGHELRCVRLT